MLSSCAFAALGAQSKSDVTTAVRPKAAPDALSAKESPQMNARILSSLLLSSLVLGALTVPALAQSNSSSSAPQAAPSSGAALEPLTAPAHTNFWDGDDPNLVNLVTHPFANKKYVQRMTRPIQDRLNELDEITTENRDKIKDVDGRAQHGIQLASAKADVADQHATDAGAKAQTAKMD